jgi:hypothetical protein
MTKRIILDPLDGETIGSWVIRFSTQCKNLPKKKNLLKYGDRFIPVSIRDENDLDGFSLSAKIQKALFLLSNIFPTKNEYFWDGTQVFWFNSMADAITFKLHWSAS